jgi:hypothetical protein
MCPPVWPKQTSPAASENNFNPIRAKVRRMFGHWNVSPLKGSKFLQRYVGERLPINEELNISNTSILTSQRTDVVSHYKQNVNTIQRNYRCVLWSLHETYKHALWQNAGFFMFKPVGTYSYHLASTGQKYLPGRESSVGSAARYGVDGPGMWSLWGVKFSAPVQKSPGARQASCTLGTGSLSRG